MTPQSTVLTVVACLLVAFGIIGRLCVGPLTWKSFGDGFFVFYLIFSASLCFILLGYAIGCAIKHLNP